MAKRALLIGINTFEFAHWPSLKKAEADAHAVAALMRDPTIGDYDEVTVMGHKPDHTRTELARAIYRLFADATRDDTVLLFIASHGEFDQETQGYHIIVRETDDFAFAATGISAQFIRDRMKASRAERQFVILDTCHSGAFFEGPGARGTDNQAILPLELKEAVSGTGRVVIPSCEAHQLSYENEDGFELSNFTHHLVEGIRTGNADTSKDGWVDVEELIAYVERKLDASKMKPKYWIAEGQPQGKLLLAKNPALLQQKRLTQSVLQAVDQLERPVRKAHIVTYLQDEFEAERIEAKLQELIAQGFVEPWFGLDNHVLTPKGRNAL